nr:hypothetical protein [uncultured Bacillus sp.]
MMVISGGVAFVLAEIFGRIFGLFYSHDQPFAVLKDVNQLIEKAMEDMESIKIMRGINLGQKQKAG